MTNKAPDPKSLRALISPERDGKWRFDISALTEEQEFTGDILWGLTGLDSYGWAKTKEKAEEKAYKRMEKMSVRLVNLLRPSKIVHYGAKYIQKGL